MVYLTHFSFPSLEEEYTFHFQLKRTCYDTLYPFGILSKRRLECLDFAPVTILYGGNGSGKTTALNVMAEKLGLPRDTPYNRSNFFEDYTERCDFRLAGAGGRARSQLRLILAGGEHLPPGLAPRQVFRRPAGSLPATTSLISC